MPPRLVGGPVTGGYPQVHFGHGMTFPWCAPRTCTGSTEFAPPVRQRPAQSPGICPALAREIPKEIPEPIPANKLHPFVCNMGIPQVMAEDLTRGMARSELGIMRRSRYRSGNKTSSQPGNRVEHSRLGVRGVIPRKANILKSKPCLVSSNPAMSSPIWRCVRQSE